MDTDPAIPLLAHLGELRSRILISAAAIIICSAIALPFSPQIFRTMARPLAKALPEGSWFIALTPFEVWAVYLKLALTAGLAFSAPIWIGQIVAFMRPAIGKTTTRRIGMAGALAGLFFTAGAVFSWAIVLPRAFSWCVSMTQGHDIRLMPAVSSYASLVIGLAVAFGIAFELPIFLAMLIRIGIVTPERLSRTRSHVIVAAFIVGAILTPPDVISQIALSLPLVLLFELGLVLGRVLKRKEVTYVQVDQSDNER